MRLAYVLCAVVVAVLTVVFALLSGHAAAQNSPSGEQRTTSGAVSRSFDRPWLAVASIPPAAAQTSPSADAKLARSGAPSSAETQMDTNTTEETADQPTAQPAGRGSPTAAQWAKLRARIAWCESRSDPRAVNKASGASGLYQFMPGTWRAVTGLEPPASAYSADVQTAAFDKLFALRGTQPWNSSRSCWQ